MIILSFSNTVVLLSLPFVQGIRKCQKIDACRCTTDEGEINLWSLASRKPNQPRYAMLLGLLVGKGAEHIHISKHFLVT